jgi:peptide/nickel transport system permease protein
MASSIRASGTKTVEVGNEALRRRKVPLFVWASAGFLLVVVLAATFAPLVSPYDPIRQSLRERLKAPAWFPEEGRQRHLLGTDQLGRDILSRVIYGSRISLVVGFAAVMIGGAIGGLLGLLSGYAGGVVDEIIMLVVDGQLAFPFILLAIGIIAVLGPSFGNLIIIVGLSGWVTYARIVRAQVLTIKEREYVLAIRGLGGSTWRILARHVVPNTLAPFLVIATLELARTILLESTLSFLGLGIQPPIPAWGSMVAAGRDYLLTAWWVSTFPGLAILIVVLSINVFGEGLRDILDPRLKIE